MHALFSIAHVAVDCDASKRKLFHTLRIWAASSGLGTVCIPVPSTSQTSARPMDHRPTSPEASSALPRKNIGKMRRRSDGLAPVLNCHTARPNSPIYKTKKHGVRKVCVHGTDEACTLWVKSALPDDDASCQLRTTTSCCQHQCMHDMPNVCDVCRQPGRCRASHGET